MTGLLLALLAGLGTYLVYSAVALGWRGLGLGPAPAPEAARVRPRVRARFRDWLRQAGLEEVNGGEFLAVVTLLFAVGAVAAWALFGGPLPALIAGGFSASLPLATYRSRRERRRSEARDAWPRLIEELRLLTGSLGRSVPQALFEVGRRGPADMRSAFAAAEREWLITTDFDRTVAILKSRLGDATADATCETLLVAHQVGGSDLDRRLAALAEDRIQDLQGRKDALAQQAGACLLPHASPPAAPQGPPLVGRGVLCHTHGHISRYALRPSSGTMTSGGRRRNDRSSRRRRTNRKQATDTGSARSCGPCRRSSATA